MTANQGIRRAIPTRNRPHHARGGRAPISRFPTEPGRSAKNAASGRKATMFIARSLGFWMMPPTVPYAGAVIERFTPRTKSSTARNPM